jgi:hypothetical protein
VILGLAVRLVYFFSIAHRPLASDAASYYQMAADLAQGRHFIPFWPPGLPLYLAMTFKVFGTSQTVARLAMLPIYLVLSYALYRLSLSLASEHAAGNLALLPLAFAPGMVCASVEPTTELPSAMLLTLVAYGLTCVKTAQSQNGMRRAEVSTISSLLGIAIGCLVLLRPASLILLFFAPFYLAWRTKSHLSGLAVSLIPAVMVLAWIGYVRHTTGQMVMINTANAKNLYYGNNSQTPLYRTWWQGSHHESESSLALDALDPLAQQAKYSRLAREYIGQHPGLFLLRSLNRVCVFFAPDTYAGASAIEVYGTSKPIGMTIIALDSTVYFIAAIGSLFYLAALPSLKFGYAASSESISDDRKIRACLLLGLVLLYACPYFIAFSHPRYHFPIEPLLMAASSVFILPFIQGTPQVELGLVRKRRLALAAAITLFLAIQVEFVVILARAGLV